MNRGDIVSFGTQTRSVAVTADRVLIYETDDGDLHLIAGRRCWLVEGVGVRNALDDMERAAGGEDTGLERSDCDPADNHMTWGGTVVAGMEPGGDTTLQTFNMGERAREYFGLPV